MDRTTTSFPLALVCISLIATGCFLAKPGPGEACEPEGPEEQCLDANACLGGFCSGGGCNLSDCRAGWACVNEGGFLVDKKVCRPPCDSDDECPQTWGCRGGYCDFPRALVAAVAGPDTASVGDELTYRVAVSSSAGPVTSYAWTIGGGAEVISGDLESSTVSVRFDSPVTVRIDATVEAEYNAPVEAEPLLVTVQE